MPEDLAPIFPRETDLADRKFVYQSSQDWGYSERKEFHVHADEDICYKKKEQMLVFKRVP